MAVIDAIEATFMKISTLYHPFSCSVSHEIGAVKRKLYSGTSPPMALIAFVIPVVVAYTAQAVDRITQLAASLSLGKIHVALILRQINSENFNIIT